MPMTATPIFPQTTLLEFATLTSPTAVTSRANITGTTGLVLLVATSTNGKRVDSITVKSKGAASLGGLLSIWLLNGGTSYLWDEIELSALTPSTTVPSMAVTKKYTDVNLAATSESLYVSTTVSQDLNIFANTGAY